MPRSKRPRVSKVIIMPTLRTVKVDVPVKYGQHASSSFMTKAHSFIKKVYGQLTLRNYIYDKSTGLFSGLEPDYIGRMKPLDKGAYSKDEIRPEHSSTVKETTAWNHPNQQQSRSEKALAPFVKAQRERYPKVSRHPELIWGNGSPFIGSIRATFTGARRNNKVASAIN